MNNIKWILAVFWFVGFWVEIAFNVGYLGVLLGWFPAVTVAYVWLSLTGAFNSKRVREQCQQS